MSQISTTLSVRLCAGLLLSSVAVSSLFFNDATLGFLFLSFGLIAFVPPVGLSTGQLQLRPAFKSPEAFALWASLAAYLGCVALSPAPNASLLQGYALMAVPAAALLGLMLGKRVWNCFSAGLLALGGVLAVWGLYNHYVEGKLTHGPFADTNSFAALANMVTILGVYYCSDKTRSPVFRGVAGVVTVLSLAATITATSRGGWLSLALVTLLLLLVQGKSLWSGKVGLIAGVLVLACGFSLGPRLLDIAQGGADRSTSSRLAQIVAAKDIIDANPEGVGFGLWSRVYPRYRHAEDNESAGFHVHNDYLEVFVETGWLGLLAMLAPVALAGLTVLRVSRIKEAPVRSQALAYLMAFMVIAIHALVNFIYHGLVISLLAGLLLGQAVRLARADNEQRGGASVKSQAASLLGSLAFCAWMALSFFAHVSLDAVMNPRSMAGRALPQLANEMTLAQLSALHLLEPRPALALGLLQLNQAVTPSSLTALQRQELSQQAMLNLSEAHRRDSSDAGIVQQMAMAQYYFKQPLEGDRLLAKALELDPTRVTAVSLYVQLRLVQQDFKAARDVVKNAMARTSTARQTVFSEMLQVIDSDEAKVRAKAQ